MEPTVLIHALCAVIRYSGLPWLIRMGIARRRATIVLYHDPSPRTFETHLAFLSKHYNFISLDTLVDSLHAQDWSSIPDHALVVTLDDGYARNRALIDIAREYGARPTIFVCSQIVGTNRQFWFHAAPKEEVERLKMMSDVQRLERLKSRWNFDPTREDPSTSAEALSREDLDAMKEYADFASHTRFHPILPTCNDESLRAEVELSKREVSELTGRECRHFAYPNGDYGNREAEAVRRAGYRSARSIDVGWTDLRSNPFRLKITGVSDDAPIHMLVAQLSGITGRLRALARDLSKKRPFERAATPNGGERSR